MIVYEYEKNVPFMWLHKAYWLLNILINLGEITFIIYDYIDEQFDATSDGNLTLEESILEFLNFFLLLCLVIYSLFIRK